MIRQCAWCRQILGEVEPLQDQTVTHGLCAECQAELLALEDEPEAPPEKTWSVAAST